MNIAFLLAAGSSKRYGKDKLFVLLKGKPVIFHSLKFLDGSFLVDKIFIVVNKKNRAKIQEFVTKEKFRKVAKILTGGKTRYESVYNCILATMKINAVPDFFIIHNAANPLTSVDELQRCFAFFKKGIAGCAAGHLIHSTVKQIVKQKSPAANFIVQKTLPRGELWEAETPQILRGKEFITCCRKYPPPQYDFTDDLSLLEAAGFKTAVVEAGVLNRKITVPQDLEILQALTGDVPQGFFIGIGEDAHAFALVKEGRKVCKLGGLSIKNTPPLQARSDGDVLLHALCNAISSALGKGSLGTYATAMAERGIVDSKRYVQKLLKGMEQKHRSLKHCAFSIEAAKPKIDSIAAPLKKNLSKLLKIPETSIGITATSGETLTPFGRGEAIRCQAVVLLSYIHP